MLIGFSVDDLSEMGRDRVPKRDTGINVLLVIKTFASSIQTLVTCISQKLLLLSKVVRRNHALPL